MLPQAIGVDFGGTSIKIAVCQGREILCKAQPLRTPDYDCPQAIIAAMCERIKGLVAQYPDVVAVGLGMPGWVDFSRGVLFQLTNVPCWKEEVPVRQIMQEALGLPIVLDNDANCMAYCEWQLGAAQGLNSAVCITLGTGIGGGIIVNNQMLRGTYVSSGEIGRTSIDYQGRVGPFGNRGGGEEYIGHNEMTADAIEAYAKAGISKTAAECDPYQLELAARAGDEIAKQIYANFAEKLACLMMNLCYTLTPDAFVLGGGVARAGDLLLEPLERCLKAQLFPVHAAHLRILPAQFSNEAGILGAALMACSSN